MQLCVHITLENIFIMLFWAVCFPTNSKHQYMHIYILEGSVSHINSLNQSLLLSVVITLMIETKWYILVYIGCVDFTCDVVKLS